MELQTRDIQILKFVFACRVVSYRQILKRFFPKNHHSIGYRRIDTLYNAGLLTVQSGLLLKKSIQFVGITEKGWDCIKLEWPFEIDKPYFKSESPLHDLRMNEVFFQLERSPSYKLFLTENILQSSSELKSDLKYRDLIKLYADAALVLSGAENRLFVYGIELEISKKAPERYKEKLASYYRADGIDGVIYITGNTEIQRAIQHMDKEVCGENSSILYSLLESDVLNGRANLILQNKKIQNTVSLSMMPKLRHPPAESPAEGSAGVT